ncbi:uncharacterized protein LOC119600741 [Lucilia sericata]|uniref:uncharacterized protein LOC119600741 n=1 Tax=Lucilia sericata TaxID=13632 RepID=UPI0018A81000|nr:uncharacterized protein LOC119600741 [Lucilia sericata]
MYITFRIFSLWALVCLEISSVLASDQYHIQTDEGPERYFRFQTNNGQFRKEKRLQDGTVIGTEAWIDAAGYLRLKDYIADKQGYRILKSKVVFVGQGTEIEDAIKSTKAVPAQSGVLVDGKHGLQNRPNSIASHSSSIYAQVTSTLAPPTAPPVTTTTERPILGYLSPAEAAKLEPTSYLGFDHYPNELPEAPKHRRPVVYVRPPKQQYNYQYTTTTERTEIPLPSIDMEPPRESTRRRIRPIVVAPLKPQPIAADELKQGVYGYSTPKPFEAVIRTTATPNAGYNYGPSAYGQSSQNLPLDVNALEGGLLPPLPPLYQRRRVPAQANNDYTAPDYNDVTVTRNGFRYILPHQYHEEEQITDTKKAGSFGYVDPFGIRRVVYYNASPEKGFIHRNRNRYVGLGAQPYDEPQPTNV